MHAEHRIIAAVLTVLLHLLVLSSLVRITADSVKPPQPSSVEKATTADKLRSAGVNFTEPREVQAEGALKGLTVVLTGTLPTLSRADATALVERAGGRVTSSVSKSTSLLVAGDEAGTKLEKARSLGTEIIDEAELIRRVRGVDSA